VHVTTFLYFFNIVPQTPNSLIGVNILFCGASVMLMDFVHISTREIIALVVILSVYVNPTLFRFSMNLRDFIDCETK
jgi:type IV secretory pathway VirB3-like protein